MNLIERHALRILFVCIISITTLSSFGQSNEKISDVNNIKTDKHLNIKGTKVFIIPPKGFKSQSNFIGLTKDDNTLIQVIEQANASYSLASSNFTKAEFEKKGQKVLFIQDFILNGYSAKYIQIESSNLDKGHGIVFGDNNFSVMLFGVCPKSDEKVSAEIKKALLSLFYDKNLIIDNSTNLLFELNEQSTSFRLLNSTENISYYTINGNNIDPNSPKPVITVITAPISDESMLAEASENMISALKENGLTNIEKKDNSNKVINGNKIYETVFYGQIKETKFLFYHFVISKGHNLVLVQGQTTDNYDLYLNEFKKFSKTIKMK